MTAAIERAANAIIAQYRSVPAVATEHAIAMLALWAADAITAGRLAPKDADTVFVRLEVDLGDGERKGGPELSDDTTQLLLEAMALDDWGTEFSADLGEMRRLAFSILGAAAA